MPDSLNSRPKFRVAVAELATISLLGLGVTASRHKTALPHRAASQQRSEIASPESALLKQYVRSAKL